MALTRFEALAGANAAEQGRAAVDAVMRMRTEDGRRPDRTTAFRDVAEALGKAPGKRSDSCADPFQVVARKLRWHGERA